MDPSLLDTLGQLFVVLGQLLVQLAALGAHWLLLIIWLAWWLLAVDWRKAWPVLGPGGWAPLVLLMLIVSLVWSQLQPVPCDCLGIVTIPNFWWQLGYMGMLVAIALFCGWIQGLLGWAPPEIDLEPPTHVHADAHGHVAH
jgi:hypothetical protein